MRCTCRSSYSLTMYFTMALFEVLVLLFALFFERGTTDISVIPQSFTIEFDQSGLPANHLTLICVPSPEKDFRGIDVMLLRHKKRGENLATELATLITHYYGNDQLIREAGLTHRNYNISWMRSREDPADSFIRVDFYDASCSDAGEFECLVRFYRNGSQETETSLYSATVTTNTLPDQALMMQRPSYDSFIVNQTIEFHCSGQIGFPSAFLYWQYRHTGRGTEKESDFEAVRFGVTHSEGPYPQGFCKHYLFSTLWVRATMELNGVEVRCLPARALTYFEKLSASFILKIADGGCQPECWNGGVCDERNTCQCPPEFSGSFCQNAVEIEKPCMENCDSTAGSPPQHAANAYTVMLLLLFCVILWPLR